jgi:hypothetical protein
MAIKVQVELDCEKLREQLVELIREIVDEVADNGPIIDNQYVGSPNSEQIAREIAQLINGSPINQNLR